MEIIKRHTEKYVIRMVSDKVMVYTEELRSTREGAKEKWNKCFICDKEFHIGGKFHVLFLEDTVNKVCCSDCKGKIDKGDLGVVEERKIEIVSMSIGDYMKHFREDYLNGDITDYPLDEVSFILSDTEITKLALIGDRLYPIE